MTTDSIKLTGKIKWLNEAKGIGLITPDKGGQDVFASVPVRRGTDKPGGFKVRQQVSYELKPGPDGDQAFNVRLVAA